MERAEDPTFNQQSLELLMTHDLNDIFVSFPQTTRLLSANYPVIEAWHSNHSDEPARYIEMFNQRLQKDQSKQLVLVHRPQFRAQMSELEKQEHTWLTLLIDGTSVGHALDQVDTNIFAFDQWLVKAVQDNLISELRCTDERLHMQD